MKYAPLNTAIVAAFVIATPSLALASECETELTAFQQEISGDATYRARLGPQARSELRQLRDAARILQNADQEEACRVVVAAIKDMATQSVEAYDQSTQQEGSEAAEIERLKEARTLEELAGQIRAEEIIGSNVRNYENADLGEIEDLLIETKEGKTSYAIVSHGGFLGLGEKLIAVPLGKLKVTSDKDIFVLNLTEEQVENAPGFERGDFDLVSDEAWRKSNEEYFEAAN